MWLCLCQQVDVDQGERRERNLAGIRGLQALVWRHPLTPEELDFQQCPSAQGGGS